MGSKRERQDAIQNLLGLYYKTKDDNREDARFELEARARQFSQRLAEQQQQIAERRDVRDAAQETRNAEHDKVVMQQLGLQIHMLTQAVQAQDDYVNAHGGKTPEIVGAESNEKTAEAQRASAAAQMAHTAALTEGARLSNELFRKTSVYQEQEARARAGDAEAKAYMAQMDMDFAKSHPNAKADANAAQLEQLKASQRLTAAEADKAELELKDAQGNKTLNDVQKQLNAVQNRIAAYGQSLQAMANPMMPGQPMPGTESAWKQTQALLDKETALMTELQSKTEGTTREKQGLPAASAANAAAGVAPAADGTAAGGGNAFGVSVGNMNPKLAASSATQEAVKKNEGNRLRAYSWLELDNNGHAIQQGTDDPQAYVAAAKQNNFLARIQSTDATPPKPDLYGKRYDDPKISGAVKGAFAAGPGAIPQTQLPTYDYTPLEKAGQEALGMTPGTDVMKQLTDFATRQAAERRRIPALLAR